MKIFLAGIIQGSLTEARIHQQDWRDPIKQALLRHFPQADIYCHYSQHPNSITYDLPQIRSTLAEGNMLAAKCDVLVPYLPSASMGTAIEMYEAHRNGAIVLSITAMAPNWVVRAYSDRILPDTAAFEKFLAGGKLTSLLQTRRHI
jgi:hypothetical protein